MNKMKKLLSVSAAAAMLSVTTVAGASNVTYQYPDAEEDMPEYAFYYEKISGYDYEITTSYPYQNDTLVIEIGGSGVQKILSEIYEPVYNFDDFNVDLVFRTVNNEYFCLNINDDDGAMIHFGDYNFVEHTGVHIATDSADYISFNNFVDYTEPGSLDNAVIQITSSKDGIGYDNLKQLFADGNAVYLTGEYEVYKDGEYKSYRILDGSNRFDIKATVNGASEGGEDDSTTDDTTGDTGKIDDNINFTTYYNENGEYCLEITGDPIKNALRTMKKKYLSDYDSHDLCTALFGMSMDIKLTDADAHINLDLNEAFGRPYGYNLNQYSDFTYGGFSFDAAEYGYGYFDVFTTSTSNDIYEADGFVLVCRTSDNYTSPFYPEDASYIPFDEATLNMLKKYTEAGKTWEIGINYYYPDYSDLNNYCMYDTDSVIINASDVTITAKSSDTATDDTTDDVVTDDTADDVVTDDTTDDVVTDDTASDDTATDDNSSADLSGDTGAATNDNKGSADTGAEGAAAVVGIAAMAGAAVLLSRKKR